MNSRFVRVACAALAVTSLALLAPAQTIGCTTGGAGGSIPTNGTGGAGAFYPATLPGFSFSSTLAVTSIPPGATCVTEVKLHGLAHTASGDCQFVLEAPSGAKHNLWCRPGGTCDFSGEYTVVDATGTAFPGCTAVGPQTYRQFYGAWPTGTNGIDNADLSSVAAVTGNWTLRVYDWASGDVGSLSSWDICFGTPPPPPAPSTPPTLSSPADGASVFGTPGVTLRWTTVPFATSYDVDFDGVITTSATNNLVVNPSLGAHTWTVRGTNVTGVGPWATGRTFTFLGVVPPPCNGPALTTLYTSNNGGNNGGAVFFDMTVVNPAGITLSEVDFNSDEANGLVATLSVYTTPNTYVGSEQIAGNWTLVASGSAVLAGLDNASIADVTDYHLAPGTYGIALTLGANAGFRYTNGTGANQNFGNADLTLSLGAAQNAAFTSTPFTPRVFNGSIRYDCSAPPPTYCAPLAPGTSNSCVPTIAGTGHPNVAHSNACVLTVSNVEGAQSGVIFYGINGPVATPWCSSGGNSFLCVKNPLERGGVQGAGGATGQCNGSLVLDWNAFQLANPLSMGNPWTAGDQAWVQGWFRDPPSCKTTFLSEALVLTYAP